MLEEKQGGESEEEDKGDNILRRVGGESDPLGPAGPRHQDWLSLRARGVIRGCEQRGSVMFWFLKGLKGTKRGGREISQEAAAKPKEWEKEQRKEWGVYVF